jgi:hypothetical protein
MTPSDRRNLRELLVKLTDESTDHRTARTAEHLLRACEQIDLATREDATDDTNARTGLTRARIDVYQTARSVLAVLESQRQRRATPPPQTHGTHTTNRTTVKP